MTDFDFQTCEFIEVEMSFLTYDDFINKCSDIKQLYQQLNKYQKRFYKWYIYANIHIKSECIKNAIWEYLNLNDINCYLELLKYKH